MTTNQLKLFTIKNQLPMAQNYTAKILLPRWRSARAKTCARRKYFTQEGGVGKKGQNDSKELENNSYNF